MHDCRITYIDEEYKPACCYCGMTYVQICETGLECPANGKTNETTGENAQANSQDKTRLAAEGSGEERTDARTAEEKGRRYWRLMSDLGVAVGLVTVSTMKGICHGWLFFVLRGRI